MQRYTGKERCQVKISKALNRAIKAKMMADDPKRSMAPTVMRHGGHRYVLSECTGEAHSNPHIDHCGMCAPLWGVRTEELGEHIDSYVAWLESTLVADLHESGMHTAAEDFEHCITLIRALQGAK